MRILVCLSLIVFSSLSWAFEHDVVKGEWAVYEKNYISQDYYYFLKINEDFSGALIRSLGHDPIVREFKAENLVKRDGYIEIMLTEYEKVIISAWKLKSGPGRLAGLLYMYKESGELFNMLHFPLHLLEKGHKYLEYEEIKNHAETYR